MLTAKEKQDWIAALRSGDYAQGRGTMKRDGRYCCLGVFAELQGVDIKPFGVGSALLMPAQAAKLAKDTTGLSIDGASNGTFRSCGLPPFKNPDYQSLSGMNDNGVSFQEIADFLEENLPTKG